MKWVRGNFEGRREDGAPIPYEGYVSGPFGIARNRKGKTWYKVIHLPTGRSIVPPFLLLARLNDAKLYVDMVDKVAADALIDWGTLKSMPTSVREAVIAVAKTFGNREG